MVRLAKTLQGDVIMTGCLNKVDLSIAFRLRVDNLD